MKWATKIWKKIPTRSSASKLDVYASLLYEQTTTNLG